MESNNNKKKYKLIILIILIISVVYIGRSIGVFIYSVIGGVENEIIQTSPSPNGEYIAYVFVRDTGATTRESYQLSILKKGQKLEKGGGNIFITYAKFDVKWLSNNELKVFNLTGGEIFKQKTKFDDITISY